MWDSATQGWYLSPHYVKGGSPASGSWSPVSAAACRRLASTSRSTPCTPFEQSLDSFKGEGPPIHAPVIPLSFPNLQASVLAPMTPQQGSPVGFLQQHSDGSCSDGGLASDGSSISGGSGGGPSGGGPGTPLVWHQHYLPHHRSPFYWQPRSGGASPTAMAPLTPMAFPQHPAVQHHCHMPHEQMHLAHPGMHHGHMPLEQPQAHGHMLPQHGHMLPPQQQGPPPQPGLAPHTPGFQPQTPTMHGGPPPPPHGLQPLGIPLPPQFHGPPLQSPSPAYMRQAGTPCLWQGQGAHAAVA